MASAIAASLELNRSGVTTPSVLTVNREVDTRIVCETITETSSSYNVITLSNGKYILLTPCKMNDSYLELKTYVEVNTMENKINNIYNSVIISSLILMLLSILNVAYNLVNISNEYSIATAICATIGCFTIIVDKYNYKKEIRNG